VIRKFNIVEDIPKPVPIFKILNAKKQKSQFQSKKIKKPRGSNPKETKKIKKPMPIDQIPETKNQKNP
jgi:hypothetical protein